MDHSFSLGILLRNLNETLRRKMLIENMLVSFRILAGVGGTMLLSIGNTL